jgi:hypothetical protein
MPPKKSAPAAAPVAAPTAAPAAAAAPAPAPAPAAAAAGDDAPAATPSAGTGVVLPDAFMAQMMAMMQNMQNMQLKIDTLEAQKVAGASSGVNTPDQPGTPRELELQDELKKEREKNRKAEAELKAKLVESIFCGCSKGNYVCGRPPCKCYVGGKTCTARCGCRAHPAVCCNDATHGVKARKKRQEEAAMEVEDDEAILAKAAAIQARKAAKSVTQHNTTTRRALFLYVRLSYFLFSMLLVVLL